MKKILIGILLVLTLSCADVFNKEIAPTYEAIVIAVIDGDTVKIQFIDEKPANTSEQETVRFIGVNTPEVAHSASDVDEFYGQEARAYTNSRLYLKTIKIEVDSETNFRDKYERLLAHIYIKEKRFNEELLLNGYAYYYDVFNFTKSYMQTYEQAQNSAKYNKKGLWSVYDE